MAKIKNKMGKTSDAVNNKKQNAKTMNPFEVHINKEKMKVLGKKVINSKGLPGVSRAKGIKKRKETLLEEYKAKNKNNLFYDKRLGQKRMTSEDDMITARFTALRARSHKKSLFNLADDEAWTHHGKVISGIDKLEDPRSDDEESFDGTGKLDSSFVENAHFAGGIFKNTGKDGAKSHKEVIDELIAESKKRKAEKQQVKEATMILTEQLDQEWKDLMPLMVKTSKSNEGGVEDKPKLDDYDKLARQLRFEAKALASDRLKSEEEVAKEEKEKLEILEKERIERMKGIYAIDKPQQTTHRSADDLCDDFVIDDDINDDMLTYNTEGEANIKIHAQLNGKEISAVSHDYNQDALDESSAEEESDIDDKPSSNDSESEDDLADLKEDGVDTDDDVKSLEQNQRCILNSTQENKEIKGTTDGNLFALKITKEDGKHIGITTKNLDNNENNDLQQRILKDLEQRKEIMERARNELPYTFEIPESYDVFDKTIINYSAEEQSVILERMIKCNHPSLSKANKEKLSTLFTFLLQFVNDVASDVTDEESIKKCFRTFSAITPYMFELAQFNQEDATKAVLEVMKEKHIEYRKKARLYPGLEVVLFLKLSSLLFPTSDFRHLVVTPCFIFIDQMLTRCKVTSRKEISYGLFLATLALEYTSLSKRFFPAAVNFLNGLLHMAIPKFSVQIVKVLPPFRTTSAYLVLQTPFTGKKEVLNMFASDLLNRELDEDYKIRTLHTVVKLLNEFHMNYKQLASNTNIFAPTLKYLELLPSETYPENVQSQINILNTNLNTSKSENKLNFLRPATKRPKALRLFEPKIEEVYDGKRHKVQSKEKANKAKLLHKLKKEKKGALREVRRDQSFLSRVKIKQAIESDKERKEKVKKIYAEAAMQQSELNALDRSKKRKK